MKLPFNEDIVLKQITDEEDKYLSWIERKLKYRKSTVWATANLARTYGRPVKDEGQGFVFKSFKWKYFLLVLSVLPFITVMVLKLINLKSVDTAAWLKTPGIFFVVIALAGILIDANRNLTVTLSRNGIAINELNYSWKEINQVYLVKRRNGKQPSYFLLLALDNGLIKRFECTALLTLITSGEKIAAYIEHYRKSA